VQDVFYSERLQLIYIFLFIFALARCSISILQKMLIS